MVEFILEYDFTSKLKIWSQYSFNVPEFVYKIILDIFSSEDHLFKTNIFLILVEMILSSPGIIILSI